MSDFLDPRPNCSIDGCEHKADVVYSERKLCSLHALLVYRHRDEKVK